MGRLHTKDVLENFKGPIIPLGSLVEYCPISAKDQSRIHQFGNEVSPGLFLGYALYVRGIWKGDIMVADLEELETMGASCKGSNISQINGKVIISCRRWTNKICWRSSTSLRRLRFCVAAQAQTISSSLVSSLLPGSGGVDEQRATDIVLNRCHRTYVLQAHITSDFHVVSLRAGDAILPTLGLSASSPSCHSYRDGLHHVSASLGGNSHSNITEAALQLWWTFIVCSASGGEVSHIPLNTKRTYRPGTLTGIDSFRQ